MLPVLLEVILAGGWQPYNKGFSDPTATLDLGLCLVQGVIVAGSTINAGATKVATLPAQCRPAKQQVFYLVTDDSPARVELHSTGEVHWTAGGTEFGIPSAGAWVRWETHFLARGVCDLGGLGCTHGTRWQERAAHASR